MSTKQTKTFIQDSDESAVMEIIVCAFMIQAQWELGNEAPFELKARLRSSRDRFSRIRNPKIRAAINSLLDNR